MIKPPRLSCSRKSCLIYLKFFHNLQLLIIFSNINEVEADIHITDAKRILKSVEFTGIQVLGNDQNLLEKIEL